MNEISILILICLLILAVSVIVALIFKLTRIKRNIDIGIQLLESEDNYYTQEIPIQNPQIEELILKVNSYIRKKNKLIGELSKKSGNQKKILTSISHDLRTPLTSLMGYLEMLSTGEVNHENIQEYIDVAFHKSVDLKKYTDNMFDWFKLSNSNMNAKLNLINVTELMRKIIIDWIPTLNKKNINISIHIPEYPIYLKIDENLFARIINNIISNALVHSKCSLLTISTEEKESKIEIRIQDNGIGIKEHELNNIFEWLYTSDITRTNGTGIGLNIAKMLVELLEGNIIAESRYEKGTAFILMFKEYKKS